MNWSPTETQERALKMARAMIENGIPIFAAARNSNWPGPNQREFHFPNAWEETKPNAGVLDSWRPGWALCAVMGVVCDGLDTDVQGNGPASRATLVAEGAWPRVYGTVNTPSGGTHEYIARTHVHSKDGLVAGVDLKAGADKPNARGTRGQGFLYLPPTVRKPKAGPRLGREGAEYEWAGEGLDLAWLLDWSAEGDGTARRVIDLRLSGGSGSGSKGAGAGAGGVKPAGDPFSDPAIRLDVAWRLIHEQVARVGAAKMGGVRAALGGAAVFIGRYVPAGVLTEDEATRLLLEALNAGGVHSDEWNRANAGWTAASKIEEGLAEGMAEPRAVSFPPARVEAAASTLEEGGAHVRLEESEEGLAGERPGLDVTNEADARGWLEHNLGSAGSHTAGFMRRDGVIVHTPRVGEQGYTAPKEGGDDGPAQVQPCGSDQLAGKLDSSHRCFKLVLDRDAMKAAEKTAKASGEEGSFDPLDPVRPEPKKIFKEVPTLFPSNSARRAAAAPETMRALRTLRGVTHTPIVRRDGSILNTPGFDEASGFLYLPGDGVDVPEVPEAPTDGQVARAVALIEEMLAGFPFVGPDDKANYWGTVLLTPLLRLLTPPAYKAVFVGAHQPGSGKTLACDIGALVHDAVTRPQLTDDEDELRKVTSAILATTTAPLVIIDNQSGTLRSAYLAGLFTNVGKMEERELGKSSNLRFTNDRLWVFNGNNPSIGGDLERRVIVVMIDADMANPETRTGFAIANLPGWVRERRNEILHALLTMIRFWAARVAAGSLRVPARAQSDSYALWSGTVAGILAACGVDGQFDAASSKAHTAGGEDDELGVLLAHIANTRGAAPWTVAELLAPSPTRLELEERLPSVVHDKLDRGEAGGRKSFGRWLMNRAGRWVTDGEGVAYVLRKAGVVHNVVLWAVEVRSK